jgi:catechol 2,3-dioxygenase-like lactoylglutathione lyase family enzyme
MRLADARLIATIPVRDSARARAFYTDVLGFEVADESEAGTLLRAAGGAQILLYPRPGSEAPAHTLAGFEVDDLEATIAELTGRGVAFADYDLPGLRTVDHVARIGPERAAWFTDSEGNVLSVSEPWKR